MRLATLAAATLAMSITGSLPADAAKRRVSVPNKFDGNWSISVFTQDGPCDRAYRYAVQIYNGQAIYPGGDVQINGRVSSSGAVSGVIASGGNAAQVSGRLTAGGTGRGVWGSTGGSPAACRGNWTAVRRG